MGVGVGQGCGWGRGELTSAKENVFEQAHQLDQCPSERVEVVRHVSSHDQCVVRAGCETIQPYAVSFHFYVDIRRSPYVIHSFEPEPRMPAIKVVEPAEQSLLLLGIVVHAHRNE